MGPAALPAAAMALVLAAAGGWLAFTGSGRAVLRTVLPRIASHWNGGPAAARGGLELRNLSLSHLSGVTGEMVVLRGEVVNTGRTKRSRLQVEATLLDERGRERGRKRVYAGNTPTEEELGAATAEEIDRRLANPLGDGLKNADVPAGHAVPFVAVFPGIAPGNYTSSVKAVEGD